jgi:hypothetical protein
MNSSPISLALIVAIPGTTTMTTGPTPYSAPNTRILTEIRQSPT